MYGEFVQSLDIPCKTRLPADAARKLPNVRRLTLRSTGILPVVDALRNIFPDRTIDSISIIVEEQAKQDLVYSEAANAVEEAVATIVALLAGRRLTHVDIQSVFSVMDRIVMDRMADDDDDAPRRDWSETLKVAWFPAERMSHLAHAKTWLIGSGMKHVATKDVAGYQNIRHISGGLTAGPHDSQVILPVTEVTVRGDIYETGWEAEELDERNAFFRFGRWAGQHSMPYLDTLRLHTYGPWSEADREAERLLVGLALLPFESFSGVRRLELMFRNVSVDWRDLEPILVVRMLEGLRIGGQRMTLVNLEDEQMRELAEAFPSLRHLQLDFTASEDSPMRCTALRHLNHHCPHLISITGVKLTGRGIFDDDELWSDKDLYTEHRLQILEITEFSDPYMDAPYLEELFPWGRGLDGHLMTHHASISNPWWVLWKRAEAERWQRESRNRAHELGAIGSR